MAPPATRGKRKPFVLTAEVEHERKAQIACSKMLALVLRPEVQWTAIDHGHSFNPTIGRNGQPIGLMEVQQRKARGVKPGIPDYLFWADANAYAIEYKIGDGELNDDQKIFLRGLITAETQVKVCWTDTQVMNTVFGWGLCKPQIHWDWAA